MNRLADQTSPYLRQHADNPVDWWPWSEEAFAEAQRRNVPVLVSIGYSACHWCHVMAHESFEDPDAAKVVNDRFVAIKVDREERPDVDDVYMEATQAMTGHGGWPMTVFTTPDGHPFFAGTYFPRERRGQMIGFVELCERVDELWHTRREDLVDQASALTGSLGRSALVEPGEGLPSRAEADTAVDRLLAAHDDEWGGFGAAPKFPQAMAQEALWHAAAREATTARGRQRRSRSTAWLPAASTTTLAAASPATRSTGAGWSRTSRRCSTTTRCSRGCTCTAGW